MKRQRPEVVEAVAPAQAVTVPAAVILRIAVGSVAAGTITRTRTPALALALALGITCLIRTRISAGTKIRKEEEIARNTGAKIERGVGTESGEGSG